MFTRPDPASTGKYTQVEAYARGIEKVDSNRVEFKNDPVSVSSVYRNTFRL